MPRGRTPEGQGFGRPSKGTRVRLCTRLPAEHSMFAARLARKRGITMSEYLAELIAAEIARLDAQMLAER